MAKTEPLDALVDEVRENEGILTVSMHRVRDACGFHRIRQHTLRQIAEKLSAKGLRHVPMSLPDDQTARVRLYFPDTPVGRFVRAAVRPGEAQDDILRELAEKGAATTLQKIRELLDAS